MFEPIRARCAVRPEVEHTVDRYAHAFKVRYRLVAPKGLAALIDE
jgi:hypothetical protein